jgi:hypothetical protein
MVVENRSLIAISSPIEAESERMMLLNKKQSKAPFKNYFDILNLSTICSACADEKKTFCPHRLENRAVWKSMASENKLRDLMPILYFRKEAKKYRHRHTSNVFIQVLGEQVKTTEYLFERKLLDPIFGADFIRATPSSILGNTVFVAVDPCSGGGSASKIGITAIYYTAKAAQLVVRIIIHLQSQR